MIPNVQLQRKSYKKRVAAFSKAQLTGKRQKTTQADYGDFQPYQRINIDQIPYELDQQPKTSYVPHDTASMVQVSAPGDAGKRHGTIQMAIHPGFPVEQCNLAMFFRGKGEVYNSEKDSYHPSVDVYFSENAWLTKPLAKEWVMRTFKSWKERILGQRKFLASQDNLGTQKDKHHGPWNRFTEKNDVYFLLHKNTKSFVGIYRDLYF